MEEVSLKKWFISLSFTREKSKTNEAIDQVLRVGRRRGSPHTGCASHVITLFSFHLHCPGPQRKGQEGTWSLNGALVTTSRGFWSPRATLQMQQPLQQHIQQSTSDYLFMTFTTQFFLEFYGISLKPPEGDTAPFLGVK